MQQTTKHVCCEHNKCDDYLRVPNALSRITNENVFALFGQGFMRDPEAHRIIFKLILPRQEITDAEAVFQRDDGLFCTKGNFHFQFIDSVLYGTLIGGAAAVDITAVDKAPYMHPYYRAFTGFSGTPGFRAGIGETAAMASDDFCRLLTQIQTIIAATT